jgi:hypothetical protein
MASEYKVYALGQDHHVVSRVDLICEEDEAAKERARRLVDRSPIELWRGQTFLGRFDPAH